MKTIYLEDVLEVRVAQVGDDLGVGLGDCSGEAEGVHSPLQVALPPVLLQGKTLTQSGLIHLHSQAEAVSTETSTIQIAKGVPTKEVC